MTSPLSGVSRPSVLIYEPRVEGHHLSYLKFITEDLASAGFPLTLAVDMRPAIFPRIREQLGDLLARVRLLPVCDESGRRTPADLADSVAACAASAGADIAFLNSFDDIASSLLRRAAGGQLPPLTLHGRLGGIYLRPRFLAGRGLSPNRWLKWLGFRRLLNDGWFRQLLFLDPYLRERVKASWPDAPVHFLPDPYPDDFRADGAQARQYFGVPADRRVFLFYGGAYRRKGLYLAVEAMLALTAETPVFLLFAGHQPEEARTRRSLEQLAREGRARVIDRYVSDAEEKMLFAAADFALLPYVRHFGSSGVLSRAAGAGIPVIASDEELVGRLVRARGLGLLFPSGDAPALGRALLQALNPSPQQVESWRAALRAFAGQYSRAAFRKALLSAFGATPSPD
jgi:glycosyltransferase involved in cell wall biosynthesis